ncbi:hypothetical protein SCHPADRAFT_952978 [Schizopora paradoxa]|uniref:Uncharacterized protein n=1 Tax=Schizopora paradoxa TaxID=27342 RepID=A0A0H2S4H3_9AGAM|nr:hypothetical protein SCHPADRAFT_952978 [Schizopora paradoxa]
MREISDHVANLQHQVDDLKDQRAADNARHAQENEMLHAELAEAKNFIGGSLDKVQAGFEDVYTTQAIHEEVLIEFDPGNIAIVLRRELDDTRLFLAGGFMAVFPAFFSKADMMHKYNPFQKKVDWGRFRWSLHRRFKSHLQVDDSSLDVHTIRSAFSDCDIRKFINIDGYAVTPNERERLPIVLETYEPTPMPDVSQYHQKRLGRFRFTRDRLFDYTDEEYLRLQLDFFFPVFVWALNELRKALKVDERRINQLQSFKAQSEKATLRLQGQEVPKVAKKPVSAEDYSLGTGYAVRAQKQWKEYFEARQHEQTSEDGSDSSHTQSQVMSSSQTIPPPVQPQLGGTGPLPFSHHAVSNQHAHYQTSSIAFPAGQPRQPSPPHGGPVIAGTYPAIQTQQPYHHQYAPGHAPGQFTGAMQYAPASQYTSGSIAPQYPGAVQFAPGPAPAYVSATQYAPGSVAPQFASAAQFAPGSVAPQFASATQFAPGSVPPQFGGATQYVSGTTSLPYPAPVQYGGATPYPPGPAPSGPQFATQVGPHTLQPGYNGGYSVSAPGLQSSTSGSDMELSDDEDDDLLQIGGSADGKQVPKQPISPEEKQKRSREEFESEVAEIQGLDSDSRTKYFSKLGFASVKRSRTDSNSPPRPGPSNRASAPTPVQSSDDEDITIVLMGQAHMEKDIEEKLKTEIPRYKKHYRKFIAIRKLLVVLLDKSLYWLSVEGSSIVRNATNAYIHLPNELKDKKVEEALDSIQLLIDDFSSKTAEIPKYPHEMVLKEEGEKLKTLCYERDTYFKTREHVVEKFVDEQIGKLAVDHQLPVYENTSDMHLLMSWLEDFEPAALLSAASNTSSVADPNNAPSSAAGPSNASSSGVVLTSAPSSVAGSSSLPSSGVGRGNAPSGMGRGNVPSGMGRGNSGE